jgi:hypothetical protein
MPSTRIHPTLRFQQRTRTRRGRALPISLQAPYEKERGDNGLQVTSFFHGLDFLGYKDRPSWVSTRDAPGAHRSQPPYAKCWRQVEVPPTGVARITIQKFACSSES